MPITWVAGKEFLGGSSSSVLTDKADFGQPWRLDCGLLPLNTRPKGRERAATPHSGLAALHGSVSQAKT